MPLRASCLRTLQALLWAAEGGRRWYQIVLRVQSSLLCACAGARTMMPTMARTGALGRGGGGGAAHVRALPPAGLVQLYLRYRYPS